MSAGYKDYYKTLGVSREATDAEVKKAFRKLARKHHPDVAEDKTGSEAKFKEINEAYEVLGDPEKRKRYDAMGPNWNPQADPGFGGWSGGGAGGDYEFEFGGTGFSDFFERFFGGGGRPRRGSGFGGAYPGQDRTSRGSDIEGDIMVTLVEAMEGSLRTISLRHTDPATGKATTQEVQVRIPAGIGEGQRLKVAGHGSPGAGGGAAGDLFLRVRLAAHPDFRVKGHDLYRDLLVAPWEAVLGATIEVGLLAGKSVQMKIPAGTQSGDQLRLGGYGLPKKGGAGDLYVVVSIQVPEQPSAKERELWEKLRDGSHFNPRV
ncbi:DnaJ C-terminal domain-containing protein [Luteolibacter marinus]|uniref:DnaJ C-terminal domain-containing protein n=1 Tax=Luteolibacter marinus TaxID=2776705 RepID=UPI001868716A|nr:DnaJ C-terminal domain-containing protein [Luteolibacter marinus]